MTQDILWSPRTDLGNVTTFSGYLRLYYFFISGFDYNLGLLEVLI